MKKTPLSYLPEGEYVPPSGDYDLQVTIEYFEVGCVSPVADMWRNYFPVTENGRFLLYYENCVVVLKSPPSFLDSFPHLPGTRAEALVQLEDAELFNGRFLKNDALEVWCFDVAENVYRIVGHAVIHYILNDRLQFWDISIFLKRYGKRLAPLLDTDTVAIELVDGFCRLNFLMLKEVLFTRKRESLVLLNLVQKKGYWTLEEIKKLIETINFFSLGVFRYQIFYKQIVDSTNQLKYQDVRLSLASWNHEEFFTMLITEVSHEKE